MTLRKMFPGCVALGSLAIWISPCDSSPSRSVQRPASGDAAQITNQEQAALSRLLRAAVGREDTAGVVALVVDRDGVLYEGAAGKLAVAHDAVMPANAIFRMASMTKPVTSVAAMQLIEAGKMSLDDPVSKFLPGFDKLQVISHFNSRTGGYETRPAKRLMTIRHLLTHTSGIGYGFSNVIERRLTETSKKNEWEVPLLNDPGDKWAYGASTTVLGMVVEKVSGESLEDYFQQHIFRPLGMVDTSYAVPAGKQARVATLHRRIGGRLKEQPPRRPLLATPTPPFAGDGGLYSTAQDYGIFMRMFLNEGRLGAVTILSPASVRLMAQNNIGTAVVERQAAADPSLTRPFPIGAGHDKFGLGFQIAAGERRYAQFRSVGSLSWAGVYNTEFWIDPVAKIGGVVMMQELPFYDPGAVRTLRDFEAMVYRDLRKSSAAPRKSHGAVATNQNYGRRAPRD